MLMNRSNFHCGTWKVDVVLVETQAFAASDELTTPCNHAFHYYLSLIRIGLNVVMESFLQRLLDANHQSLFDVKNDVRNRQSEFLAVALRTLVGRLNIWASY
jgi:hypothetical protein